MKYLLAAALALVVAGCSTVNYHGGAPAGSIVVQRLLLPPFVNATDDEHASRALTEMTGSALVEAGIPLYRAKRPPNGPRPPLPPSRATPACVQPQGSPSSSFCVSTSRPTGTRFRQARTRSSETALLP